jgi:peptidoglycan hydrolase CwlO-like protein
VDLRSELERAQNEIDDLKENLRINKESLADLIR